MPHSCSIASTTLNYYYDVPQISPEKRLLSGQSGHIYELIHKYTPNFPPDSSSRMVRIYPPAENLQSAMQAQFTHRAHSGIGPSRLSLLPLIKGISVGASQMNFLHSPPFQAEPLGSGGVARPLAAVIQSGSFDREEDPRCRGRSLRGILCCIPM